MDGKRLLGHELAHVVQQSQQHAHALHTLHPQLQRQPNRRHEGHKEATITARWTEDFDMFYIRFMDGVIGSHDFRGISPDDFNYASNTESTLRDLVRAAYSQYSREHSDRKEGQRVKFKFSAYYDPANDAPLTHKSLSLVADPSPAKPATVTPPQAPVGGRFASDPTFKLLVSRLVQYFEQHSKQAQDPARGKAAHDNCVTSGPDVHVALEFNGTQVNMPSYQAFTTSKQPATRAVSPDQVAREVEQAFEQLVSFGPGILNINYCFENSVLVLQKSERSGKQAPAASPTPHRRAATTEPLTLDDCNPDDVHYGECLLRLERGNTRRALDAAHDVAEAFLDPTAVIPGGEEAHLAMAGAAQLYSKIRETRRIVKVAEMVGQDTRTVQAVEKELKILGELDEASTTALKRNSELREALVENPMAADALKFCHSPCHLPEFATPGQVDLLDRALANAEEAGLKIDRGKLREFLHSHNNVVDLSEAIDRLSETIADIKEQRIQADSGAVVDAAEAMEQLGVRESKPVDVRLQEARFGTQYDRIHGKKYPANQVAIRDLSGKLRWLDSYDPVKGEIISRKSLVTSNGQIALADETTMISYFQEFALKYPDGHAIAEVPSTEKKIIQGRPLAGQKLTGTYILEVPPQKYAIPDRIREEASARNITIRDENGKVY